MTLEQALAKAKELFGDDAFCEHDEREENCRFYVGACPQVAGPYQGFMGFSWEEAFAQATKE